MMPKNLDTISTELLSKRAQLREVQVAHIARLITLLEEQTCRHFQVDTIEHVVEDRYDEFMAVQAYEIFVSAAHACGFVTRDGTTHNPLENYGGSPSEAVAQLSLSELRQLMHFIVRSERWNDGGWSAILEHLRNGVLQAMARRLQSDDTLYAE